ncbi:hypothetical protein, partial [Staphylococcus auricularis]|uniref:hypothetical protein n=1 Tax=Staphylococcus auricularis TaxID=29379 RepID=UPI001CD9D9C6
SNKHIHLNSLHHFNIISINTTFIKSSISHPQPSIKNIIYSNSLYTIILSFKLTHSSFPHLHLPLNSNYLPNTNSSINLSPSPLTLTPHSFNLNISHYSLPLTHLSNLLFIYHLFRKPFSYYNVPHHLKLTNYFNNLFLKFQT